jgi:hypothetical protein
MATGTSYQTAGELIREKTGRVRRNEMEEPSDTPTERENGNLVLDWVESFTECLWNTYGPKSWPDVIAVDELPLSGRSPHAKALAALPFPQSLTQAGKIRVKKGGRKLFTIIGALGYTSAGKSAISTKDPGPRRSALT